MHTHTKQANDQTKLTHNQASQTSYCKTKGGIKDKIRELEEKDDQQFF